MKLLQITARYPAYLKKFYSKRPELAGKPYAEQKVALDYDAFGWADFLSTPLTFLGYEVKELVVNHILLQRAWALENGLKKASKMNLKQIAVEQAKRFKPEILFYPIKDEELFNLILPEIPSTQLVIGWAGSAFPKTGLWNHMKIVLSCAPESVNWLRKNGVNAIQLHHGFDPRINERLKKNQKRIDLSFVGQITRYKDFHLEREHILEELCKTIKVQIYSPSADLTFVDNIKAVLGKVVSRTEKPMRSVNQKLKPFMSPGVFGLDMYQILRDSRITLNVHADSSPTHASNMRLFEATGVGTCLLTDWKENLHELFEPDKEVVTYKSAEECVEKVKWLLDHPKERKGIAMAGQARCLRDHTFAIRARQLDEIIKKYLRGK